MAKDLDGPFGGDQRLVVGADHHARAVTERRLDQLPRGRRLPRSDSLRIANGLRRHPVLAIGAVQVAAEHAETQGGGARAHVVEGLLLDGVALHRLHISPGHIQLAVAMEADLADSGVAFGYRTAVAAGVAADAAIVDPLPQVPFADVARQTLGDGGHRGRSPKLWSRKTDNSQSPVA